MNRPFIISINSISGGGKTALAKARHPYLDTCKDKEVSDLILDGCRSLDDLNSEVLARMGCGPEVETLA